MIDLSGLPEIASVAEVAAFLRVDEGVVNRLCRTRGMGYVKIGRRKSITKEHLRQYMEANQCPGKTREFSYDGVQPGSAGRSENMKTASSSATNRALEAVRMVKDSARRSRDKGQEEPAGSVLAIRQSV